MDQRPPSTSSADTSSAAHDRMVQRPLTRDELSRLQKRAAIALGVYMALSHGLGWIGPLLIGFLADLRILGFDEVSDAYLWAGVATMVVRLPAWVWLVVTWVRLVRGGIEDVTQQALFIVAPLLSLLGQVVGLSVRVWTLLAFETFSDGMTALATAAPWLYPVLQAFWFAGSASMFGLLFVLGEKHAPGRVAVLATAAGLFVVDFGASVAVRTFNVAEALGIENLRVVYILHGIFSAIASCWMVAALVLSGAAIRSGERRSD